MAFYTHPHIYSPPGSPPGQEIAPEGLELVDTPLPDRESRVWPSGRGNFDVTYGSHAVHLALYHGEPCVAVHHGGGWEWMTLRGPPGQFEALSGVQDERARYALAYAIITGGAQAHRDAIADTSAKWARAFREKRIKNRRARGTVRTEIIPAWIGQVDGKDATPRLPSSDAAISMARSVAPEGARVSAVSSL